MDRQRSDEWVARVVAWHNRHPLARRILPAQVQSMGWVSLPFTATAAARSSAASSPQRGQGWRAAFTEQFLPRHSPRRIARWALRHAQEATPDLAGSPLREIAADDRKQDAGAEPVTLWLATAAIVDGRAQCRVLLAPDASRQLLGRRLWSLPRLAAVVCVAFLAVALPSGVSWVPAPERDVAPVASELPPEPAAVRVVASDSAAAPAPAALPEPPPDVPVMRGSVPLPQRAFVLDETAKAAAREAGGAARAARAAALLASAPVAYAVAAPRVRSQAEGKLMRAALQAAVAQAAPVPGCRVEALPVGEDWRVVCWPFLHRHDAERLRGQLITRGHRLEVIEF